MSKTKPASPAENLLTPKSAGDSAAKSVTLKRTVTIKAVVTDKFKEYMNFEIQEALKVAQFKVKDIDAKLEEIARTAAREGAPSQSVQVFVARLEAEKLELVQSLSELNRRADSVKQLALNSHFVQGMVDGFVSINVGDNLYEKLGAMEIVIKDGMVQAINAVAKLEPNGRPI